MGKEVTYEIRVTNQGSAQATNVRLVCHIPPSEEYVSSSGATPVQGTPRLLTTDSLPNLAPKAVASWRVVVKAIQPDDARFKVQLTSDQFTLPIDEAESTEIY